MAKEESTAQTNHEEVIVHTPDTKGTLMPRHKPDTQVVVIAVGASIVLFVVGLILGYLLGNQSAEHTNGSMMNGNTRTFRYWTQ